MNYDAEKQKQQARLKRLAELMPNRVAHFGKGMGIGRMRVDDTRTGDVIYASPEGFYWGVEPIKEKKDAELLALLEQWESASVG